ncbi:TadE family type IV pilus minor pilin [Protaetiibacter larvae]|uniref:TadE-like domain-containing protein n=1 Tax=Protaetiibacter larvae TaxID=2592654 RepID=A0A5C1Y5M2_9MICO|nr:TadE family type IV pilus minor pilin [Protaetiibacter larvae]QEO08698.1 hypothetical protein FLP23_00855 [Protaetiibacter larvae]
MRSPSAADDAGSAAAEFAVALPAVVLVLAVCLGAVGAGSQQLRLQDAAAVAARALGRGAPFDAAAVGLDPGTTTERWTDAGLVCVRLTAAARGPAGIAGLRLSAASCAADAGR